jgi:CHAT domain-containing protein/Flp pilus assembly protein TadD
LQAQLQFDQGYEDQPLQAAEVGLHDTERFPDLNWKFRVLLAGSQARSFKSAEALKTLAPEPPPGIPPEVAWLRGLTQAWALCDRGQFSEAEQHLAEARARAGNNTRLQGELALFRGRCERLAKNLPAAESHFRQTLASDPAPPLRLEATRYLAWTFTSARRFDEAIEASLSMLNLARSQHALPREQAALGNLGFIYGELRDMPNSRKYSDEAIEMAQKIPMPRDEGVWRLNLGRALQAMGLIGEAELEYKKALELFERFHNNRDAFTCIRNLTVLRTKQGDLAAAEALHKKAAAFISDDNRPRWLLDDATLLAANGKLLDAERALLDLMRTAEAPPKPGQTADYLFLWLVQIELARTYDKAHKDSEAERWFLASIKTSEIRLQQLKNPNLRGSLLSTTPIFDDYVAFLLSRNRIDKAFQVSQMGRARSLEGKGPFLRPLEDSKAWLAKIQRSLPQKNTSLFSYFMNQNECYLWVVTSSQLRFFRLPVGLPDLDNAIKSYRREMDQLAPLESSASARKLFDLLVKPAMALAPHGQHILMLADSSLYKINFETLVSTEGGAHYWIDDVDIDNINSVDSLSSRKRGPATATAGVLLMGDAIAAGPAFPPLPHAHEEMDKVAAYFKPETIRRFSKADATPEAYVTASPGNHQYIHFAAHGAADDRDPEESAVILSPGKDGGYKLTARQIAQTKIHADVVTISACKGAGTNLQSLEGLLGLGRAFMNAGAHQVIAALWDVDDATNPTIMDGLYAGLTQHQPASQALRAAKLKLVHSNDFHKAPYYWAPLQVYTGR